MRLCTYRRPLLACLICTRGGFWEDKGQVHAIVRACVCAAEFLLSCSQSGVWLVICLVVLPCPCRVHVLLWGFACAPAAWSSSPTIQMPSYPGRLHILLFPFEWYARELGDLAWQLCFWANCGSLARGCSTAPMTFCHWDSLFVVGERILRCSFASITGGVRPERLHVPISLGPHGYKWVCLKIGVVGVPFFPLNQPTKRGTTQKRQTHMDKFV